MDDNYSFSLSKFELIRKIGSGSFCKNYIAKEKNTNLIYWVKVSQQLMDGEENPKAAKRKLVKEAKNLSKLYHPSTVKFIGFSPVNFKGQPKPVIITEFVSKYSLRQLIDKEQSNNLSDDKINDTQRLIILYGVASAMSYLHSHKIIHRNLNPSNILLDDNLNPKITDFFFPKIFHQEFNPTAEFNDSFIYLSPETITNIEYTKTSDVYSYSIIAYQLLSTKKAFKKFYDQNTIEKVRRGERPKFEDSVPESYRSLIERCWSEKVSERPTFEDIVQELRSDEGFITGGVEKDTFLTYVDYIDECLSSTEILTFNDFIESKSPQIESATVKIKKGDLKVNFHLIKGDDDQTADELYNRGLRLLSTDKKKASHCFKKAARKGHRKAMYKYGTMLYDGDGIPKNEAEGAKYIKTAAHNGEVDAMYTYGMMVKKGENDFTYDSQKVVRYLKKSADKGKPEAMYAFATMLLNGDGISKSKESGLLYMKVAAHRENVDAMYEYGVMLKDGIGTAANKTKAARYLKKAADRGQKEAAAAYSRMLSSGDGIQKDKKEAERYMKMANLNDLDEEKEDVSDENDSSNDQIELNSNSRKEPLKNQSLSDESDDDENKLNLNSNPRNDNTIKLTFSDENDNNNDHVDLNLNSRNDNLKNSTSSDEDDNNNDQIVLNLNSRNDSLKNSTFSDENDENKEYVNGHSSSIGNDNDDDDDDGEFNLKPAVNSDLIDRQLSSENQAQSFRLSSNGIKDSRSDEELSFNEEEEAKGRKDTGEEEEEGGGASSESIELSFNSKEIMNADDDGLELPMEEEDEHRRGAVSQDFSFDEEESEDKDESIKTLSENTPSVNNLSGE
ncbi:hypothetical protein M9Y10_027691 [Tritrichomonas musculus]|uniref:Protein kinase domain-containing protein n=1 Tax=Tritrichomonas musculus TaxID=1915356 RepID=A0ABR2H3S4_9EUKA